MRARLRPRQAPPALARGSWMRSAEVVPSWSEIGGATGSTPLGPGSPPRESSPHRERPHSARTPSPRRPGCSRWCGPSRERMIAADRYQAGRSRFATAPGIRPHGRYLESGRALRGGRVGPSADQDGNRVRNPFSDIRHRIDQALELLFQRKTGHRHQEPVRLRYGELTAWKSAGSAGPGLNISKSRPFLR